MKTGTVTLGMVLGVSVVGLVLIAWAVFLVLLVLWLWRRSGLPRPQEDDTEVEVARSERRRGSDRRRINVGPPAGMAERRAGFDRRGSVAVGPRF